MKRKMPWHWLLCILLIAIGCLFPTETAKADIRYLYDFDEKEQAYYIYHIYATEKDEVFELPSRYNGYPVVGISDTSMDMKTKNYIKKLIIPSGYKEIGSTFSCCENLEEVVINAELTSIEKGMFSGCSKLTEAYLNQSPNLTGLDFTGCNALRVLWAFENPSMTTLNVAPCKNLYYMDAHQTGVNHHMDFVDMPVLWQTIMWNSQVPSATYTNVPELDHMNYENAPLAAITITNAPKLEYAIFVNTQLHLPLAKSSGCFSALIFWTFLLL